MTATAPEPARRRPSRLDPAPGTWGVIGAGEHGSAAAEALQAAGVPVVSYDRTHFDTAPDASLQSDHVVIGIDEIDDIDALAVTSVDARNGEITTDYYAGIVLATGPWRPGAVLFLDPELINADSGQPRLAHDLFTPFHPALIGFGLGADQAEVAQQAQVIARYALQLRDDPRAALAFHRHACAEVLYPEARGE